MTPGPGDADYVSIPSVPCGIRSHTVGTYTTYNRFSAVASTEPMRAGDGAGHPCYDGTS